ncbi:MAG: phosphate ABC transporter permease subunit PstC [Planctomycetota bacterium]|nr:MAG: phosphate ABC transporter permease subunit PstC [Planctomycetota bacterium]
MFSKERFVQYLFFVCALMTVVILGGIFIMLLYKTLKFFELVGLGEFFLERIWKPSAYSKPTYGVLAMLVSTLMVTVGAMVIAIPVGIGAAAYLSEVASPHVREWLKPLVELLAGVPSVAIGFLGIVLVGPFLAKVFHLSSGINALNGSILLAIMALPTIISVSEDAFSSVPLSYREASCALGATKWQTIVWVTLPAALPGILVAVMLGIGRAVGETMTVLMATGNAKAMPHSFFDSVATMTAVIASEIGEVDYGSEHYYGLFAVGCLLFLISLLVNLLADYFNSKMRRYA